MKATDFILMLSPPTLQVEQETGLSHKAMIAIAAVETAWGDRVSRDVKTGETSNNYCNIKDSETDDWHGPFVDIVTTEFLTRQSVLNLRRHGVKINLISDYIYPGYTARVHLISRFRKYLSPTESFQDFAHVVQSIPRYGIAWSVRTDPESFVKALHAAGYATDPNYSNTLISIIRSHFQ